MLVEYHGCDPRALNDAEHISSAMRGAAEAAGATVVTETFHRFAPQGVSGVVVIEESHLAIHTWPEMGYAAVDFYTCGPCDPDLANQYLQKALGAQRTEVLIVERGRPTAPSMQIERHAQSTRDGCEGAGQQVHPTPSGATPVPTAATNR